MLIKGNVPNIIQTKFQSILTIRRGFSKVLFLGFAFFSCIYKMVGSEYSMENYQSSKLSIGTAMKNPKMLNVFPDSLRNKRNV